MSDALCDQSTDFARELRSFLLQIDPARFRAELQSAVSSRYAQLRDRLQQILDSNADDSTSADRRLARLYDGLQKLSRQFETLKPRLQESAAQARREWQQLQMRLQPTYGAIADSLEHLSAPVPALRSTNLLRSLYHLGTAVLSLVAIQFILGPLGLKIAAAAIAAWCWGSELLRIRFPRVTEIYLKVFGSIAHPHEMHRVNSATWYATALMGLAYTVSPMAASVAVMVLGIADPMAALVGRRYGHIKLRGGRTLEGSLTFVVMGTLAAVAVLGAFYPQIPLTHALLGALAAATLGALAELFSFRLDDKLTIPLAAGWGVTTMLALL